MKKTILLAITLLVSLTVSAQQSVGTWSITPRVGVSISNVSDLDIYVNNSQSLDDKRKAKAGFTIGAEVEYQATEMIGVSAGLYYTSLGCRFDDFDFRNVGIGTSTSTVEFDGYDQLKLNMGAFSLPILANIYVAQDLAVKLGVEMMYSTNAKLKGNYNLWSLDTETEEVYLENRTEYEQDLKDNLKKFGVAIPIGISYEYQNVVLDARYHIGLTKVFDGDFGRNNWFTFTVGYRFGL